jgi:hypothetical protein
MRRRSGQFASFLSPGDLIHGLLTTVAPSEIFRMTTATIIPFPRPAAPAGQERLHQALAALNAALAAQAEAVANWRDALGDLRESVHGLHESLLSYNARLENLGERVGALDGEAKRLEAWADDALRPG